MLSAASKTRSRGSNRYGEVLVARHPCFALLSTGAETSASNLLRTEIDGESSAISRAFKAKGLSRWTANPYRLNFQGKV